MSTHVVYCVNFGGQEEGVCILLLLLMRILFLSADTGYKFSESHEWVSVADDVATIGITNYAQVSR